MASVLLGHWGGVMRLLRRKDWKLSLSSDKERKRHFSRLYEISEVFAGLMDLGAPGPGSPEGLSGESKVCPPLLGL